MRRANFDADQSSLWSDLYIQDHRKKKMYGFTGLLKQFKLTFLLPNIAMEVPLLYIDSCL